MPRNLSTSGSTFSHTPPPAARHYHPTLSIWLSVDPMSDKYPGVSPYAYCGNNPVVLKDPNGDSLINFYKQIVINAQELYNMAVSQNQPDLSHETKVLEEAKISCYYVDQFINGLSDDQYKALNNIKDEQGNPINIIVDIDYNLETVAANKPLWTKDKQLLNNSLNISINPFRDENNKESNLPIFDWRKFARHEGGHAYYIIRKSVEYFDWLVKEGHIDENGKRLHKYNGHGKGDKSAEHARIWETGIIKLINDEQR